LSWRFDLSEGHYSFELINDRRTGGRKILALFAFEELKYVFQIVDTLEDPKTLILAREKAKSQG
jgi:hypothetical protein